MKYLLIIGLIYSLTACKSMSPEYQKDIQVPVDYSSNSSLKPMDSIRKVAADSLPAWDKFYNDPALTVLIDSAFKRNIDLQIMDAKVQQVQAGVVFTRGIRLPDLHAGLSAGVRKFGDYTIDGVGNYDTKFSQNLNDKQRIPNPVPDYFVGVHSTWEIDIWGRLKNQKVAALRRFMATEFGRQLAATELVSEVAGNYYALVILDEQRLKLIDNIDLQEKALQVVEAEFETGRATEVAINLTKAQLLETKKLLIEIEQQLKIHENKLSLLSGTYPREISRSQLRFSDSLFGMLILTDPHMLLKNRPDILQAEQSLVASKADLISARKAFYPTVQLNSSFGLHAFRMAVLFDAPASIAYNLASGMMMPVLNRRALKAQLLEASGKQKEAYLNYEKVILTAYTEVNELVQLNQYVDSMISLKNEELILLNESVSSVRELYVSGRASFLEILTTQEYFLHSQIELLDLQLRKMQIQISLFKALGGGKKS
jgi:NodT family efflux transporter outer membrane factor (OMF) lipoprotein